MNPCLVDTIININSFSYRSVRRKNLPETKVTIKELIFILLTVYDIFIANVIVVTQEVNAMKYEPVQYGFSTNQNG